MRRLMWFVSGYTLGLIAVTQHVPGAYLIAVSAVFVIAACALFFLGRQAKHCTILALCAAGIIASVFCFRIYNDTRIQPLKKYDGTTTEREITISDYGTVAENGSSAIGTILLNDKEYNVMVYLNRRRELAPGDKVRGDFYLIYVDHSFQHVKYYQGEAIYLQAYSQGDIFVRKSLNAGTDHLVPRLRQGIKHTLLKIFPEDLQGFAMSLLLGDSSLLSNTDDNNLQNSGIRHIIAVSGLHISILFSFIHVIVWKKRWLTALLGIPLLLLFAALAGFTPSVVRACFMQILMIIAMVLDRDYDPATALSLAVLIILGIDPLAVSSVSFQLSVGCVAGIFLFSSRLNSFITSRKLFGKFSGKTLKFRFKRMLASSASMSLSAMSLTIPLGAHYFGTVCTVGVLTNLVTLWAITYIFCGTILCLILSFVYLPLAQIVAYPISWIMRYVLAASGLIAKIPYATISSHNIYVLIWLIFSYALLVLLFCMQKKSPWMISACIISVMCISLIFSWLEGHNGTFRMTVLDVGQGQCIILQSDDKCYVIDCGGQSAEGAADMAAQLLRTQGIDIVDGLILTHYDQDHAGGVDSFAGQIYVKKFYCPDMENDDPIRTLLAEKYADRIVWVQSKQYITFADTFITLLPGNRSLSGNNGSMSILYQIKNYDILITGDLQAQGEQNLLSTIRLPRVEILVAGHHGSADSTTIQLLHKVQPKAVVISVGRNNSYLHPSAELLHRLELFRCKVWRTDLNGTIVLTG